MPPEEYTQIRVFKSQEEANAAGARGQAYPYRGGVAVLSKAANIKLNQRMVEEQGGIVRQAEFLRLAPFIIDALLQEKWQPGQGHDNNADT